MASRPAPSAHDRSRLSSALSMPERVKSMSLVWSSPSSRGDSSRTRCMSVPQPYSARSCTIGSARSPRRQALGQFAHDVAQPMDLRLAGDVALAAAGELDVLVARHHLLDRRRMRAGGLPHVDREDQRVAARHVVEHDLDGRVRIDAAVPVRLAIDGDRRKGRRQRAGRHDVARAKRHVPGVEVAHLAGADVDGADRQPDRACG